MRDSQPARSYLRIKEGETQGSEEKADGQQIPKGVSFNNVVNKDVKI